MNDSNILPLLKVAIIGAGNLSWSLIPAIQTHGAEVVQLITRTKEKRKRFCKAYGIPKGSDKVEDLEPDLDLVFLTVNDHAVASVAKEIAKSKAWEHSPNTIFVHTSGSIPLDALSPLGKNVGVFYPMQIFTKSRTTPFDTLPLFLEGNEKVLSLTRPLAERLSNQVYLLDSTERLRLHLGAVMVCNFTNYLYRKAAEMAPGEGIKAYEPLIRQHIEKVFELGPENTQTGPAVRGDQVTLDKHLELLRENPELREIYSLFSGLIRG